MVRRQCCNQPVRKYPHSHCLRSIRGTRRFRHSFALCRAFHVLHLLNSRWTTIPVTVRCRHFPNAAGYFLCPLEVLPVEITSLMIRQVLMGIERDALTRFDISKLTGALCSVLSVNPLSDRQFSSSMAESLDTRCRLNWTDSMLPFEFGFDFVAGISSLIAPGAEQLRFFDDSRPLEIR